MMAYRGGHCSALWRGVVAVALIGPALTAGCGPYGYRTYGGSGWDWGHSRDTSADRAPARGGDATWEGYCNLVYCGSGGSGHDGDRSSDDSESSDSGDGDSSSDDDGASTAGLRP